MIRGMDTKGLQRVASRMSPTSRVTVLTGAGVSLASGVPTFRGVAGMWKEKRPEDLATAQAFARDPAGVWEWYAWRRRLVAGCTPNAAHVVLARWSRDREGCVIITQNVDDLHVRAGTSGLLRLHGTLWRLACAAACGGNAPWGDEDVDSDRIRRCTRCGAFARPGVVWFGEALDPAIVHAAQQATRCDVFIAVGTSSVVYPAAGFMDEARRRGAFTVEINPEATPASVAVDVCIAAPAEQALPALDAMIGGGVHHA